MEMNNSKKYQHRLQMRKDVMEIMVKPITNNGSIATTTVSQEQTRMKSIACEEELSKLRIELSETTNELRRKQELCYILHKYFNKIEKLVYNHESSVLESQPPNYEQIELHLRETLRRLQDIGNGKLNHIPVIYRNSNIKSYKILQKSFEK